MKKEKEEKKYFPSGATSTKQPRLALIPYHGLRNIAVRFELGIEKHGPGAYNALTDNIDPLRDKEWLIERCSHVITHAYNCIARIKSGEPFEEDSGAIGWAGAVLGEASFMTRNGVNDVGNEKNGHKDLRSAK